MINLLIPLMFLVGCGNKHILSIKAPVVEPAPTSICPNGGVMVNGIPACNGQHGAGVGVNVSSVGHGCISGGNLITFFRDFNSNNIQDVGDVILTIASVCNGSNASISVTPATTSQCANGGWVFNGYPICNGAQGPQGPMGPSVPIEVANATQCPTGGVVVGGYPVCNGAQGPTGPAGTTILAVQLCPGDTSSFTEYGVIIGGELYAVLYNNGLSHPHHIGMVKLNPGTYSTTTTASPCTFTYSKTPTHIILTAGSNSVLYPL